MSEPSKLRVGRIVFAPKAPRYIPPPVTHCPYCGRRVRNGEKACTTHADLPGLEPL